MHVTWKSSTSQFRVGPHRLRRHPSSCWKGPECFGRWRPKQSPRWSRTSQSKWGNNQ